MKCKAHCHYCKSIFVAEDRDKAESCPKCSKEFGVIIGRHSSLEELMLYAERSNEKLLVVIDSLKNFLPDNELSIPDEMVVVAYVEEKRIPIVIRFPENDIK